MSRCRHRRLNEDMENPTANASLGSLFRIVIETPGSGFRLMLRVLCVIAGFRADRIARGNQHRYEGLNRACRFPVRTRDVCSMNRL